MNKKDVEKAEEKIRHYIKKTPLKRSEYFSSFCGGEVYLKLENEQITNSFKIRGALNKMLNMSEEDKKRGIISASSGNHAQAVAIVAKELGIRANVIVPENTPNKKIDKIKKYNAEITLFGETFDDAEQKAISVSKEKNIVYISAYNDEVIIAGQGTIGLEVLRDLPKVDAILVPVGGGGLISGISIAAKEDNPKIKVFGIQSEASPAMYESLKAGKIVEVEIKENIVDGISGGIVKGAITFEMCQKYVDRVILVKENTIKKAVKLLWENEKEVVEGAGAIGIAAILENKDLFRGKNIAVIITGGNIDDNVFQEIIKE